ncbi:hypothetical protein J2S77_002925 [Alkalibacillus salilacus]|uniref:Uncharacterized protein n=1 Tax=Alkalibacillus salilacus TaxID=284582 RepID=A0ABT9VIW5_9BACI|nr:hypothetical protein [Alkalibacillus salilacus]
MKHLQAYSEHDEQVEKEIVSQIGKESLTVTPVYGVIVSNY